MYEPDGTRKPFTANDLRVGDVLAEADGGAEVIGVIRQSPGTRTFLMREPRRPGYLMGEERKMTLPRSMPLRWPQRAW